MQMRGEKKIPRETGFLNLNVLWFRTKSLERLHNALCTVCTSVDKPSPILYSLFAYSSPIAYSYAKK